MLKMAFNLDLLNKQLANSFNQLNNQLNKNLADTAANLNKAFASPTDDEYRTLLSRSYDNSIDESRQTFKLEKGPRTDGGCHWDWSTASTVLPPTGQLPSNNYVLIGFCFYVNPDWGIGTIAEAYYADILNVNKPSKWIVFKAPRKANDPPEMRAQASSYRIPDMNYDCCNYVYILPGIGARGGNIPLGYAVTGVHARIWDKVMQIKLVYMRVFGSDYSMIEASAGCGGNNGRTYGSGCHKFGTGQCRLDNFSMSDINKSAKRRRFVTNMQVSYNPDNEAGMHGVKTIDWVQFKDYTDIINLVNNKSGLYLSKCCSSNSAFPSNSLGKALCEYDEADVNSNGQAGGNCMAKMKTFCSDPKNITSGECIDFFKANKDATVGMLREFCAKSGDLALAGDNAKICGCLMPQSYYNKYLDDTFGHSKSVRDALASYGPECYSAQCGAALIKKPDSETRACPALNVCAQQASVSAGNQISSQQLNNYNSCIFNQYGGGETNNKPTSSSTPAPPPSSTPAPPPRPVSTPPPPPPNAPKPVTATTNNVSANNNSVRAGPENPSSSNASVTAGPEPSSDNSKMILLLLLLIVIVIVTVLLIKQKQAPGMSIQPTQQ